MIAQLLLSVALGIGILTLGMIALFNTAGQRIHEHVQVSVKGHKLRPGIPDWHPVFCHVYWTDAAQRVRIAFGDIPKHALWMAAGMGLILLGVGVTAHFRVADHSNFECIYPYVAFVLSATLFFVAGVVLFAYRMSKNLYIVMHEQLPRPRFPPPAI